MSARSRVLSGYRRLFRTRKFVFAGDAFAMQETRKAIKDEFIKNKYAPTEGDHFEGLLSVIDEVDKMLRFGVVRGELNPKTGNYAVKLKPEHMINEQTVLKTVTTDTIREVEPLPEVEVTKSTSKK